MPNNNIIDPQFTNKSGSGTDLATVSEEEFPVPRPGGPLPEGLGGGGRLTSGPDLGFCGPLEGLVGGVEVGLVGGAEGGVSVATD